jgi:hypothetical protein
MVVLITVLSSTAITGSKIRECNAQPDSTWLVIYSIVKRSRGLDLLKVQNPGSINKNGSWTGQ